MTKTICTCLSLQSAFLYQLQQGRAQVLKSGGYIMDVKSSKLVIFNFSAQTMPRRSLVDSTYVHMCCESSWQLRLSTFIHVDILVLISVFGYFI